MISNFSPSVTRSREIVLSPLDNVSFRNEIRVFFFYLYIYIYIQTLLFYNKYFDEFEFLANEEEEEDLKSVYIIRSRNDDVNRIVF